MRHSLVEARLGMVRRVAGRIHQVVKGYVDMDDVVSLGMTGLVEAAARYDAGRGVPFDTFALYRIRGAIYDGLRRMSRVPRRVQQQIAPHAGACLVDRPPRWRMIVGQRRRASKEPHAAAGRHDSHGALYMTTATDGTVRCLSLEAVVEAGRQIPCLVGETPDAALVRKRLWRHVGEAVRALPARERHFIEKCYVEGKSLVEAGQELGLSRSWSSRLHARAVDMLRDRLRDLGVEQPDDG